MQDYQGLKREREDDTPDEQPPKKFKVEGKDLQNPQEKFKWAVENNSVEEVELLLSYPDINPGADHNWAIQYTAEHGFTEIVRLLLSDKRVDPVLDGEDDIDQICPISLAVEHGHLDVVRLFLADPRIDPTFKKSHSREEDIVPLLVVALERNNEKMFFLLLTHEQIKFDLTDNEDLLHITIKQNNFNIAQYLLSIEYSEGLIFFKPENPEDEGDDPEESTLFHAIRFGSGSFEILRLLIDDNRFSHEISDKYCVTFACELNKPKAVEMLLPHINLKNEIYTEDGFPVIMAACLSHNPEIIKLVLSNRNIDLQKAAEFGFQYVAKNCSMLILKFFLDYCKAELIKFSPEIKRNCVRALYDRKLKIYNLDEYKINRINNVDSYSGIDFSEFRLKEINIISYQCGSDIKIHCYVRHDDASIDGIDLSTLLNKESKKTEIDLNDLLNDRSRLMSFILLGSQQELARGCFLSYDMFPKCLFFKLDAEHEEQKLFKLTGGCNDISLLILKKTIELILHAFDVKTNKDLVEEESMELN